VAVIFGESMYKLDEEKTRDVLISQGIKPYQIDLLLKNYPPIDNQFGSLIEQWFVDQEVPEFEINGITVEEVMNNHRSHFLVAIRDMNRLLDPDLSKEKREQWRRILQTQRHFE